MWKNHLIISWRNLIRNKAFSILNISGLSVGIAASLLLYIIVSYEWSYNKFIPNYKNIYQIGTVIVNEAGEGYTPGIPTPALDAYRNTLPDVAFAPLIGKMYSQITITDENGVIHPDKKFADDLFFTDEKFFDIFQWKWIAGSPEILQKPNTLVLSKSNAEKYFGKWENALFQKIQINNLVLVEVGGIIEDFPLNSDLPLKNIASYITYKNNPEIFQYDEEWGSNSSDVRMFVNLPPNMEVKKFTQKLNDISKPFYTDIDASEQRNNYLLAVEDIHYDQRFSTFGPYRISKESLTILSLIGIFIIVMACINFINLATAQATNRSKEIGVRKVLGSDRSLIFWQIIFETSLLVILSVLLALGLVKLALPHVESLIGITEKLPLFTIPNIIFLTLIIVVVSFLAGSYPALVMSGFKTVKALKGKQLSNGKSTIRRTLVVVQFIISQTLIIGTLIAILQMDLIHQSNLGFNKEGVLVLNSKLDSAVISRQASFKNELNKINGVESVTFNDSPPSSQSNMATNMAFDRRPEDEKFHLFFKIADENYFSTYNIPLAAGRYYTDADSAKSVVINETLVRMLKLNKPEDALGKEIRLGGEKWLTVVGVVKDFVNNSLRDPIKPLLIGANAKKYSTIGIKIQSQNLKNTQTQIIAAWNKTYPEYIVNDYWFDESIAFFYRMENKLTLLYKIFSGIAILLSCLGLYGLIAFMTVQKRKEVGIRKVLGASVQSILFLFSKEIILLITISLLISIPLAWYISNQWLQAFSVKIQMSWIIFLCAALVSIGIAWATIFFRSIKAATANPINNLRED